ncbi:MAG: FAD-dependent oxidoreductase [Rubrivivax sp.]
MEQEFDVVVVGSGGGGLLGAVRAADEGLSVLLVEKAELVGGTTATSGGALWVPCNDDMPRAGLRDSVDGAFRYMKRCVRGLASDDRVLAYVETARQMARYLGQIGVPYCCVPKYSDYYPTVADALPGGRTMEALPFNARKLGLEALDQMRPTNPGQLVLGRMQMTALEAHSFLARETKGKLMLLWILLRYFLDYPWRSRTRKDRRLTGGQALAAGLFHALRQRQVPIWLNTPLRSLVMDGARVAGVRVEREGKPVTVRARKGVLLAAGGFERNQQMREQYLPQPTNEAWAATPPACNSGDAIRAGAEVGGALALMEHAWGVPTLEVPKEKKFRGIFVERSMPGCMVVNARGERFVDESAPYLEFQQAMMANHAATGSAVPSWVVFDADFRRQYPIGPLMPASAIPDRKLSPRWLGTVYWKADTLDALAAQIGVDAKGLAASAARMGEYARSGKDVEFDRGGNAFDRYYGDPTVRPNPNLAPIAKPPFYAMKLYPGDIGTKGGLVTDRDARVLDAQGRPIEGLYCVGNNAASVMGPSYPGAGATIGPALTFAFRAVAQMVGKPIALERTDLLQGG